MRDAEDFFAGILIAIFVILAIACVVGLFGSIIGLIGCLCGAEWGWAVAGQCFPLFCGATFVIGFFVFLLA